MQTKHSSTLAAAGVIAAPAALSTADATSRLAAISTDEIYHHFTHPLVRALAWCIGSPSIFNPQLVVWQGNLANDLQAQQWLNDAQAWLRHLDSNPSSLERLLPAAQKRPLGKTFELLIGYWLENRPDVAWVQPSLVARRSGRTVGEFDHIYSDRAGHIHALELTVKFYLRVAPANGADGYVGPMVFDFMAQKISRMATHQMRLGFSEDGQQAIKKCLERRMIAHDAQAPLTVQSHAIVRGYLFEPRFLDTHLEPIEVGAAHLRASWCTTNDLGAIPAAQNACWRSLEGNQWLGPQRATHAELHELAHCLGTIGKLKHVMVARFEQRDEGRYEEVERMMILRPDARVLRPEFIGAV